MSQSPTESFASTIEDSILHDGVYGVEVSMEETCGDEQSQVSDTAYFHQALTYHHGSKP